MSLNLQPTLQNQKAILYPLQATDFEELYQAASNPKTWEQHPNPDRYKREVFEVFFKGAIASKGAFKIVDKASETVIGSTRYYDYNPQTGSILIGYTFYSPKYWGKGYNSLVKASMLNYIFQFVSTVYFHVGSQNLRSQIAITKLGAQKIAEQEVAYFGEATKLNFVYQITKQNWLEQSKTII
jgi:RimJ/RimL family protein N-acetyltransferase